MYPTANEKIIISRRVPCRLQTRRIKKVPQFSSFTMRPATAPAESCCTDHACATESAPAAEALSDARYSWQVDGMDCAACARKVETAVRQVPGVSQVRCCSPQKSCWLTPRAMSALRLRTRSAGAGYTLRDADAPAAKQTRGSLLRDNLPLLTLVIMMALSWGLEQANHPAGQLAFIATTTGWPVAGCPPGATPDQERELVRH